MIAALVLAAASLGPCADRALCTARLRAADALLSPSRAALASVGLREGDGKAALKLEPKVRKGDVSFAFEVEQQGAELVVRALSLHRPPSVYGLARLTPQALPKPPQQAKAVEVAIRSGMQLAMDDLQAQLDDAAGVGRRSLKLSVQVTGLDAPSRKHVAEVLLPCLMRQFDALGAVTAASEVQGYLEQTVEYVPAPGEPREPLQWQAERLKELTLGARGVCAAPQKSRTTFAADPLNHGVVVNIAR